MKAVIVELKGRQAIALTKKGDFIKIKSKDTYQAGCEVDVPEQKSFNGSFFMKAASIAAGLLLAGGVSLGAYAYSIPYSYINVDINPSVELAVNRFDRVIGVKGLNEDGQKIIEQQELKNKKAKDSVDAIVKVAVEKGYLSKDKDGAVLVSVASKNEEKAFEMRKELEEKAKKDVEEAEIHADVLGQNITFEKREEALKYEISPGKYNLIQRLKAAEEEYKSVLNKDEVSNTSVTVIEENTDYVEYWSRQSVQAIMKEAKEYKAEWKEETNPNYAAAKNKDNKPEASKEKSKGKLESTSKPTPSPAKANNQNNNGNNGNGNNGNGNGSGGKN